MIDYQAIPAAQCPISAINQLLKADERFLINGKSYLFQPKTIPCLKELLSLLKNESIKYRLVQKSGGLEKDQWVLSLQNLTKIELSEDSILTVEASCQVESLRSFLYERELEIGLPNWIDQLGLTIGEFIFEELNRGLKIRQLSIEERILAVELVKRSGSLLKWGWPLEGAHAAPMLQQLVSKIKELNATLVKLVFITERIPPKRLFLQWPFENWKMFREIEKFTSTWERLDCLISSNKNERSYILGQISGLKEEMDAFIAYCPIGYRLMQEDQVKLFKAYFKQKNAAYRACCDVPLNDFADANYYWYHGLIKEGNLIYLDRELGIEKSAEEPLWKKRMKNALFGEI